MRAVRTSAAAVFVAVAMTACAEQVGTPELSDADRAAVEKSMVTDAMAALAARDFEGYASLFTEDVALLPPNAPVFNGRAGMMTFLNGMPPYSEFELGSPTTQVSGDLAYVQGTYSMVLTPPGASEPVADRGKWLAGARKQTDGSWKGTVVMFNSDLPSAPPATDN